MAPGDEARNTSAPKASTKARPASQTRTMLAAFHRARVAAQSAGGCTTDQDSV